MNASFKLIDTLKLFIAFKMAQSCCFSLGGNLDFPEYLQKKFYNINYRKMISGKSYNQFTLVNYNYPYVPTYVPTHMYLPTYLCTQILEDRFDVFTRAIILHFFKNGQKFCGEEENDTDTCYRFPPKKFYNINYYKMIRGMIKRVFWWKEGGSMPPHYRFLNWQNALGIL